MHAVCRSLRKYLVLAHFLWEPPIAVYIAEVELATRSKNPVSLVQDTLLVGREVDHAVADDDIHRLILNPSFV